MNVEDLVVGQVYFQLLFQSRGPQKPIIITYEYLKQAKREDGHLEEGFVFHYLPAFQYQMADGEVFPSDDELTFFEPSKLESLLDLKGLIRELGILNNADKE